MTDTFIHRWSQKKAQENPDEAETERLADEAEAGGRPQAVAHVDPGDAESGSPEAEEKAEPPPLDTLSDDSDYSAFLSPEVDESLRKLALRKLFKAPFYNIVDGLNDYDDDFTTFEGLGNIVTSDMKFHAERKEAEAREAEQARAGEIKDDQELEAKAAEASEDDADDDRLRDAEIAESQDAESDSETEFDEPSPA